MRNDLGRSEIAIDHYVLVAITSPSRFSSWTVTWYRPSLLSSVMSLTQWSGSTCTLPVASASAR